MIKCLAIQIDQSRDPSHSADELLALLKDSGRYPEVDRDPEMPELVQMNLFSESLAGLWTEIKGQVFTGTHLSNWLAEVAIVVCEGEEGWDDEKLLWHFDHGETLDEL
jgi:hypothetical protein